MSDTFWVVAGAVGAMAVYRAVTLFRLSNRRPMSDDTKVRIILTVALLLLMAGCLIAATVEKGGY